MPIKFKPNFTLTETILHHIERVNAAKEQIKDLPLTPKMLLSLRESAKLYTTHYSTMMEGNRLDIEQVQQVIEFEGHFAGRKRDEGEVKGYYYALEYTEKLIKTHTTFSQKNLQMFHALVMGNGKKRVKPTPYRYGQNVIRDGKTRRIVYLPPQADDVPVLMKELIDWIHTTSTITLIKAAIAHYQFATIHPYYDGNGRTARMLTIYLMHTGGYDAKGIYSLEEYYARDLSAYYQAISIGPSHNYYLGRAEADITPWIEYFIKGVAFSFEKILATMQHKAFNKNTQDHSQLLRQLDPKQRKALSLFSQSDIIISAQLGKLFHFKPRTSSQLANKWVQEGFLEIVDTSKKGRKYRLTHTYKKLL